MREGFGHLTAEWRVERILCVQCRARASLVEQGPNFVRRDFCTVAAINSLASEFNTITHDVVDFPTFGRRTIWVIILHDDNSYASYSFIPNSNPFPTVESLRLTLAEVKNLRVSDRRVVAAYPCGSQEHSGFHAVLHYLFRLLGGSFPRQGD